MKPASQDHDGPAPPAHAMPRSPTRVVQILETLAVSADGLPLSRLSLKLGMPKTSLLSLLRALEASEYVVNDDASYRLGPAAFRLAAMMTGGNPLVRAVRAPLLGLAERSKESALLAVLTDNRRQAMCIDIVESHKTLRFSMVIGTRIPLHNTTAGRAMLAFQSDAFIESYLGSTELRQYTDKSPLSKSEIVAALNVVRQSGVSETFEEYAEGVGGIGAPIADPTGRVHAAVQVAAPVGRVMERRAELAELVREAGARMSQLIGYTGTYPPPAR